MSHAVNHTLSKSDDGYPFSCLQDVRTGVGKLLNFVNSAKRLADIRDAVWEILTQVWRYLCVYVDVCAYV